MRLSASCTPGKMSVDTVTKQLTPVQPGHGCCARWKERAPTQRDCCSRSIGQRLRLLEYRLLLEAGSHVNSDGSCCPCPVGRGLRLLEYRPRINSPRFSSTESTEYRPRFSSTAPGINCLVNPNGEAWRNKIFYLQLIFNSACKP